MTQLTDADVPELQVSADPRSLLLDRIEEVSATRWELAKILFVALGKAAVPRTRCVG